MDIKEFIEMAKRLTRNEWIDICNKIHNNKYDYSIANYINKRTKVKIICPIHGEFEQIAHNHRRGQGCPLCGQSFAVKWNKHNYNRFINESNKRFDNEYEFPNIEKEYENSHSILTIKHKQCGNLFHKIACDHITSKYGGCVHCYKKTISSLEDEIEELLIKNNINYQKQKKFKWLGSQTLDFYLPEYNTAIECQGIQHFKPIEHFGGEKEYFKIIHRDEIKKHLCEENDVKLLYFSNLGINYPYKVSENKEELLNIIKSFEKPKK